MSKGKGGAQKVYRYLALDVEAFVIARSQKGGIAIFHQHGYAMASNKNIELTGRDPAEASDAVNFKVKESVA